MSEYLYPSEKHSPKILIVEDNEAQRRLLRDIIAEEGFDAEAFETAGLALAHAGPDEFAVAVVDLRLPDMDGTEVVRRLHERDPAIRIIVHTGFGTFESARDAVNYGAFAFVEKLGDPRVLIGHIHRGIKEWMRDALEVSASRFRSVIGAVPDLLFVLDRQGVCLEAFVPERTTERWPAFPVPGKRVSEDLSPDEWKRWQLVASEALVSGIPQTIEYQADVAGEPQWYSARVVRMRAGRDDGTLWVSRNVTIKKRAEIELITAKEKAEEMNRLTSAFLTSMSHEIRTPLTSILGFATLIAEEVDEEKRELAHLIRSSGKRLLDTLNSVLDLSLLEAGKFELALDDLDVGAEVREKVRLLLPIANEKGLRIGFTVSGPTRSRLDRSCLDRILNNLIGNAIKFTHEGEVRVEVGLRDRDVLLQIQDTGIGISPSFRPYLFEEFKQESTGLARLYEGSGIGLAITKRLVDMMDGRIEVDSEQGRGTTFRLYFPALNTTEVAAPAQRDFEKSAVAQVVMGAKVLFVEDDPNAQRFLRLLLQKQLDLEIAADEEMALILAKRRRFDLVFLDINLGKKRTGVDVMHALRALPGYSHTPIVAMTAYALPQDRQRFLDERFTDYISKPFTKHQILDVIERSLIAHS
jgi:signal transduction histidine kinase/response regulator of citrate/malate metabolism